MALVAVGALLHRAGDRELDEETVVADRMGHKNATETLRTCSHLWPSSDDQTRQVLDRAFATVDALHAGSAHR